MTMEQLQVGQHLLQFEGSDLLIIRIRGDVQPGQMGELARRHDERLLQLGRLFVLCDLTGATEAPSMQARRELKNRPKKLPPHWVAYVGLPRGFTVPLDLIIRAVANLTGSKIVHRYFSDETTALTWLREIRRKFSA